MNQLIFSKVGFSIAIIGTFFSASYFINSAAYILVNYIKDNGSKTDVYLWFDILILKSFLPLQIVLFRITLFPNIELIYYPLFPWYARV